MLCFVFIIFFFKQKTAYEMRISDWISDVCSSDLLLAADLAARGFSGPPQILEGEKGFFRATCADPQPERLLADADAPWQLRLTSIKPWPCCRHTHPTIDAGLELATQIGNRSVERIHVVTSQPALDVSDRRQPPSEHEAQVPLHHT